MHGIPVRLERAASRSKDASAGSDTFFSAGEALGLYRHIAALEDNMSETGLTTGDFTEENEPFSLFGTWLKEAEASEINDPTAVA
ncbi:MAG: hypothetical protein AAAB11_10130, partial [Rhizobium giardinii]